MIITNTKYEDYEGKYDQRLVKYNERGFSIVDLNFLSYKQNLEEYASKFVESDNTLLFEYGLRLMFLIDKFPQIKKRVLEASKPYHFD